MNVIGNILWIIFGGWLTALLWCIFGLLACISIVGLPWGRACFVMAGFAFMPFGYESISREVLYGRKDIGTGMPGVIGKAIRRFAGCGIPVIAGGLVETKAEVTDAINCGAAAVSTGRESLWYI